MVKEENERLVQTPLSDLISGACPSRGFGARVWVARELQLRGGNCSKRRCGDEFVDNETRVVRSGTVWPSLLEVLFLYGGIRGELWWRFEGLGLKRVGKRWGQLWLPVLPCRGSPGGCKG